MGRLRTTVRWAAVLACAWACWFPAALAQDGDDTYGPGPQARIQPGLPFDVRYVGGVLDVRSGERARDSAFINPLNEAENIVAWVGTPRTRAGDVTYAVSLSRIENDGRYVAVFQFRMIDHEGIQERSRMLAVVEGPDGTTLAREEIPVTGAVQVARVPVEAPMPGEFRLRLRCGGARYFMGAAASSAYLMPQNLTPRTESEMLAPQGIHPGTLYVPPEGVYGPVQETSSVDLINPSKEARNAFAWQVAGPGVHQCGVRWRFSASLNQGLVGRPVSVGVQIALPVDAARLAIVGPQGRMVGQWTIYSGTDIRTLWFPTELPEPGEYTVELIDEGVGRSEGQLFRQLMLNVLPL